jgi:hypothetical protein
MSRTLQNDYPPDFNELLQGSIKPQGFLPKCFRNYQHAASMLFYYIREQGLTDQQVRELNSFFKEEVVAKECYEETKFFFENLVFSYQNRNVLGSDIRENRTDHIITDRIEEYEKKHENYVELSQSIFQVVRGACYRYYYYEHEQGLSGWPPRPSKLRRAFFWLNFSRDHYSDSDYHKGGPAPHATYRYLKQAADDGDVEGMRQLAEFLIDEKYIKWGSCSEITDEKEYKKKQGYLRQAHELWEEAIQGGHWFADVERACICFSYKNCFTDTYTPKMALASLNRGITLGQRGAAYVKAHLLLNNKMPPELLNKSEILIESTGVQVHVNNTDPKTADHYAEASRLLCQFYQARVGIPDSRYKLENYSQFYSKLSSWNKIHQDIRVTYHLIRLRQQWQPSWWNLIPFKLWRSKVIKLGKKASWVEVMPLLKAIAMDPVLEFKERYYLFENILDHHLKQEAPIACSVHFMEIVEILCEDYELSESELQKFLSMLSEKLAAVRFHSEASSSDCYSEFELNKILKSFGNIIKNHLDEYAEITNSILLILKQLMHPLSLAFEAIRMHHETISSMTPTNLVGEISTNFATNISDSCQLEVKQIPLTERNEQLKQVSEQYSNNIKLQVKPSAPTYLSRININIIPIYFLFCSIRQNVNPLARYFFSSCLSALNHPINLLPARLKTHLLLPAGLKTHLFSSPNISRDNIDKDKSSPRSRFDSGVGVSLRCK